jgi:hypothetical protein
VSPFTRRGDDPQPGSDVSANGAGWTVSYAKPNGQDFAPGQGILANVSVICMS